MEGKLKAMAEMNAYKRVDLGIVGCAMNRMPAIIRNIRMHADPPPIPSPEGEPPHTPPTGGGRSY